MRIDSVRCEVTDLLADQCAHCQHPPGGGARPAFVLIDETAAGPRFAAPAPAESSSRQFGPVIAAQYSGQCAGCLDRIDEGDSIRHSDPHGGFIHEGCEDE